jgi:hypothetical protein
MERALPLLSRLGVNLSTTQIQNLLRQLGVTDLSSGLMQRDLSRILYALGLDLAPPTGWPTTTRGPRLPPRPRITSAGSSSEPGATGRTRCPRSCRC